MIKKYVVLVLLFVLALSCENNLSTPTNKTNTETNYTPVTTNTDVSGAVGTHDKIVPSIASLITGSVVIDITGATSSSDISGYIDLYIGEKHYTVSVADSSVLIDIPNNSLEFPISVFIKQEGILPVTYISKVSVLGSIKEVAGRSIVKSVFGSEVNVNDINLDGYVSSSELTNSFEPLSNFGSNPSDKPIITINSQRDNWSSFYLEATIDNADYNIAFIEYDNVIIPIKLTNNSGRISFSKNLPITNRYMEYKIIAINSVGYTEVLVTQDNLYIDNDSLYVSMFSTSNVNLNLIMKTYNSHSDFISGDRSYNSSNFISNSDYGPQAVKDSFFGYYIGRYDVVYINNIGLDSTNIYVTITYNGQTEVIGPFFISSSDFIIRIKDLKNSNKTLETLYPDYFADPSTH